jgi:ComEC/Rec2-related protein
MKRPLVGIGLGYTAGILLGVWEPLSPGILFVGAFGFLILAALLPRFRAALLWPLLIISGWLNYSLHTAVLAPHDLRRLLPAEPALVTVQGVLAGTPREKITLRNGQESWRQIARVRVSSLRLDQGQTAQPATGEIVVLTPGLLDERYFTGQPVEISGVSARPAGPLAPGLFDWAGQLAHRGIYFQLKTRSTNDWTLRAPVATRPPLTDRFQRWARAVLARGLPADDQSLRLIWAMTLGWRTAFTGDIDEPFLQAGTMHLFAIDGLRIALVSGFIVTLLRALRLARAWCGAIALPLIWFYTAATGWEASAVRASVMLTIVLGGWALRRPGDLLNSLAAAALIILALDPRQLFEAGFQLSFLVVLVIARVLPRLNQLSDRWLRPDPLLPLELASPGKRWSLRVARRLAGYGWLSLAAWLGSIPLAAIYFHLFNPVSTPANIIAVPLGTAALGANFAALLFGNWFPWATELCNHLAWYAMKAMTHVSVAATHLPGAYWYVTAPSLAMTVAYYAGLLAAFSGWFQTRRRIAGGLVGLILLGGTCLWSAQMARAQTRLTVLPLNGGHAIFVQDGARHDHWLINCGDTTSVDVVLKDYLHAQGINALPHLVLTAGDLRNSGGAAHLSQAFPLGEFWTSDAQFRSPAYREALAQLTAAHIPHRIAHADHPAGHDPSGDPSLGWEILFPPPNQGLVKADDAPLVLRQNFAGASVLLLSDLSRSGQNELLTSHPNLHADLVIAGLPAEGEPLCDALLEAIHPQAVIIADSLHPATRRASPALQTRLANSHLPIHYTRETGAIEIIRQPAGWKVETSLEPKSPSSPPAAETKTDAVR